jgi:YesN/AraC family two-component response regulator
VSIFIWILAFWAFVALIDYYFTINQQYNGNQLDFSIDLFLSFILGGVYIVASRHKSLPAFALVNHSGEEVPVFNPSNHAKLKEKLIYALEAKKLFLKKDLTINDLCAETGSNRTYISQLINSEFHMNFNTFVNRFRVEKAKEILNVEDNSLEEIASMSGFNSLASFNRAFKKSTGNYPGSMRKRSEKIT